MQELNVHKLKILPQYYIAILENRKTFEIRYNDRDYKVGDVLELNEIIDGKYTGNRIMVLVTYIHVGGGDFGVEDGWVIIGFKKI